MSSVIGIALPLINLISLQLKDLLQVAVWAMLMLEVRTLIKDPRPFFTPRTV
jgi:hypothetical protein